MIFGEQKHREMARSILPSKSRKGARDSLRIIKQQNRTATRQALRRVLFDEEYEVEDDVDLGYYPYEKIRGVVNDRRGRDKIAHFEKWAIKITKDIETPDGRLAHMRGILPKGLIGDHAISHLRGYDEFETEDFRFGFARNRFDAEALAIAKKARLEKEAATRIRVLNEVVASGWGVSVLNSRILRSHSRVVWDVLARNVPTQKFIGNAYVTVYKDDYVGVLVSDDVHPRLFRGSLDIEPFIADLWKAAAVTKALPTSAKRVRQAVNRYGTEGIEYVIKRGRVLRNPESHPEWWSAFYAFLDVWEREKGDRRKVERGV